MAKVIPLIASKQIEYEWEQMSLRIMLDCKALKITHKELAQEIGVTPQAISKQFALRKVQVPTIIAYQRLKGEKEK